MLKQFWTGATLALIASLCAGGASAAVVNFNGDTTYTAVGDDWAEGGLSFSGGEIYLIPPDTMLSSPSTFNSFHATSILATNTDPLLMTLTGGGAFSLQSVDLGLGWWNNPDPGFTDTETVTGQKANCVSNCTVTDSFTVGYSFLTYSLTSDFTGLSSVSFAPLTTQSTTDSNGDPISYSGWLGFDNITFTAPGVVGEGTPEPAAWALMIMGFGGVGAVMRRNRRAAVAA